MSLSDHANQLCTPGCLYVTVSPGNLTVYQNLEEAEGDSHLYHAMIRHHDVKLRNMIRMFRRDLIQKPHTHESITFDMSHPCRHACITFMRGASVHAVADMLIIRDHVTVLSVVTARTTHVFHRRQ